MLTHIKKWSYNRKLQEKRSTISASPFGPVNPGKMIGVLYELEKLDDHTVVKLLKQKFEREGRVLKTLSYIDQKIDVESLAQRSFSRKELKWDGMPDSHFVEDFISWEFDLLICPLKRMRPCYEYIIHLSPARLKIGLNTEKAEDLYHVIIDIPGVHELSDIFDEIFRQLNLISR